MEFYPPDAVVPAEKRTDRLLLRPLRVADVELDYAAVMSSAASLRRWSQSEWPADDFSLAENRSDLERHEREHLERKAFTFTVLDPLGARCLGCVYIMPLRSQEMPLGEGVTHPGRVTFWVRDSEQPGGLDRHLLATLREWLTAEWALGRVVFTISEKETRQAALLRENGLEVRSRYTLDDGRKCCAFV